MYCISSRVVCGVADLGAVFERRSSDHLQWALLLRRRERSIELG
jgi:hypothetical protein